VAGDKEELKNAFAEAISKLNAPMPKNFWELVGTVSISSNNNGYDIRETTRAESDSVIAGWKLPE
jgi:hypothetical protein